MDQQLHRLERALNSVAHRELPRSHASATNKSLIIVRKELVKAVSRETKIPQKKIRKRVVLTRAKPNFLRAKFSVWQQSVSVADVSRTAGVGKKVRWAGEVYPRSFYNKAANGKLLALQRKGRARYPIEAVKVDIKTSIDKLLPVKSAEVMGRDFPGLLRREFIWRINRNVKFS